MTVDGLTDRDLHQLADHGIPADEARRQLELLRSPPPATRLDRPATLGDGIQTLGDQPQDELLERFEQARAAGGVRQFVPASGAASRMFRELAAGDADALRRLAAASDDFAFRDELESAAQDRHGRALADLEPDRVARLLLNDLGYGTRAKGLIPFHRRGDVVRTAFEEHLAEAAGYGTDESGRGRLHFTVAPDQESAFRELLSRADPAGRHAVAFSHQSPATDTLAVDGDGAPFRRDDGSLLLRPGGHGALLDNLARLARRDSPEVIFLKNIDNVVPDGPAKEKVIRTRKLLGGLVLTLRDRIFTLLSQVPDLAHAFARPLRVCGVVRNDGEPGGGPFWVERDGHTSLQIVEGSQVADDQRRVFAGGTHFNPVDLACSVLDPAGRPYDLERFVDPSTVFVADKTHQGRPLRALERPGLWNGAMAGWNTVFVEVPAETFAPVKTVFDLLRPEHR